MLDPYVSSTRFPFFFAVGYGMCKPVLFLEKIKMELIFHGVDDQKSLLMYKNNAILEALIPTTFHWTSCFSRRSKIKTSSGVLWSNRSSISNKMHGLCCWLLRHSRRGFFAFFGDPCPKHDDFDNLSTNIVSDHHRDFHITLIQRMELFDGFSRECCHRTLLSLASFGVLHLHGLEQGDFVVWQIHANDHASRSLSQQSCRCGMDLPNVILDLALVAQGQDNLCCCHFFKLNPSRANKLDHITNGIIKSGSLHESRELIDVGNNSG